MEKADFLNKLVGGDFAGMVKEALPGETLTNSKTAYNIVAPLMAMEPDIEQIYVIFLNAKNKIIVIECIHKGTINRSAVYPREIVKRIINLGASAIIMAHNHPSGDPKPSLEDIGVTKQILAATRSIDAELHDHIITGIENKYYSMADKAIIATMRESFRIWQEASNKEIKP